MEKDTRRVNNKQNSGKLTLVALVVASLLCIGPNAYAELPQNNALEQILDVYRSNASAWEGALRGYALQLFWLLAGIQFTWTAIRLVIKGADLGDWLSEVTGQILFIGFFLTLLLNSSQWANAIVSSFRIAADSASSSAGGSTGISPSDIFDTALTIVNRLWQQLSVTDMGDSVILAISAITILLCFALIAAFMIVALVESYIVISSGVLLMGFGGSRWTSDYALKIINYAVSVGAKLFVLQLLVGLGERMIRSWSDRFMTTNADITDLLVVVGASVVFLAVTKIIPEIVQGLINGTSLGTNAPLVGMASSALAASAAVGAGVAGAATGGVGGAVGAGSAVHGAVKLASEQLASSSENGSAPTSKAGRLAALTGNATQNLVKAGIADLGGRLSGRRPYGTTGGRMGADMRQQASDLAAERTKPKQPAASSNGNGRENTIRPE